MELGMEKKARYYLMVIYKPDENNDKKVKILDRYFIKGNKDKAKIRYKNKISSTINKWVIAQKNFGFLCNS